jgi:hypothetical protein
MKKEIAPLNTLDEKPQQTIAYKQWLSYQTNFLIPCNVINVLKQCRNFYYGIQYDFNYASNTPKPVFNLCKEGVERIGAKITGTKRHISFVADKEDESLNMMDNFYEFQTDEMDDDSISDEIVLRGLIDGTAVALTTHDQDTIGTEGLYKGFLKRTVVNFEQTFWSNPWTNDPQDQRYFGYWLDMEVGAARELVEGTEEEKKKKKQLVVSEGFFDSPAPYHLDKVTDSDMTRVYIRFFRLDGEAYFEVATEYTDLSAYPHALNPKINESRIRKAVEDLIKKEKEGNSEDSTTEVSDYATDQAKYALFTKAIAETHEGHVEAKDKFSRYPVSIYSPYPVQGCILGQSFVSMIIPNQKIINYVYLLVALIMQNHAMPKILAKPEALGDQSYDTTPNQIITDYSTASSLMGVGWGITRLSSGDAVNSNLIEIGSHLVSLTRKIFGFDDLQAEDVSKDTSGYAVSQLTKQINLTLEIPQKRFWRYIKENARTDLMYFKHYVDQAKYFEARSDSEMDLNENYRQMEQDMINAGKSSQFPRGTVLEKTRRYETRTLEKGFFDSEFNVSIEVEQGIAGSELTESQHFNQLMQYVAQGNIQADLLKVMVENDPGFSAKTRSKMKASLEGLETSQLAMKDQQIQQLQQVVTELQSYMKFSQQVIKHQQNKQKATEQAAAEQTKVAAEMIKAKDQEQAAQPQMSESEVKSNNAKGISGSSFSKGGSETIYNTGS